jgi:hypothetical protein
MFTGQLSHAVLMFPHSLEELLEPFIVLFSEPCNVSLRPLEKLLILLSQVVSHLLLDLVQLLLLLIHDHLVLVLFLYALYDSDSLGLFLVVLNFCLNAIHFDVNLLDDWIYLHDLLLEGFGLGFEVLEGGF